MPDVNSPGGDALTQHPPSHTKSSSMSHSIPPTGTSPVDQDESADGDGPDRKTSAEAEPAPAVQSPVAAQTQPSIDPTTAQHVDEVLKSELGVATLLNRLKQSIASAKEFSVFLKKRSSLEEDHAQSLKKLCRMSQDSMHRPEHRTGSFAQSYDEMMAIHERMADNSSQFASSLGQMHDDLVELSANAERSRKMWKTNGLAAEQKVADLEQAMRKSKAKYDSLAEEYDRARTGDSRQGGKRLGLKGPKSAAQHEEDLLRKVQAADSTYSNHVQNLQSEKSTLISTTRPEAVKALQDLVKEIDSGLTLQMQKFAAFNEKLLLGNGMIVSPMKGPAGQVLPGPRGLKSVVSAINNDRDFHSFVAYHHSKVPPPTEVKYERHPAMSQPSYSMNQATIGQVPQQPAAPPQQYPQQSNPSYGRSSMSDYRPPGSSPTSQGPQSSVDQGVSSPGGPDSRSFPQQHGRSASQGNMMGQWGPGSPAQQQPLPQQQYPRNASQNAPRYGNGMPPNGQGPPQLGNLAFQNQSGQRPPQPQGGPSFGSQDARGPGAGTPNEAPAKPVFGIPLNRLYERDVLAVPMVVHQCIQAVDLYGLGVEGIYRQSGSLNHVNKLKNMFNSDSENPLLDFRNPENFYHDINSVTGLLKQFFRDLPDPILTLEHHDSFIAAAKHDDDIVRRDSLHAIINSLPDPNYATLRALALHLFRVMDKSHVNRMNSHNLAVIFGPTLMGTDPSTAIADAGWQIKVVDTILQNTYQIFDED